MKQINTLVPVKMDLDLRKYILQLCLLVIIVQQSVFPKKKLKMLIHSAFVRPHF